MEKRDISFKESIIAKVNIGLHAFYEGHVRFEEIMYKKVGLKVSFGTLFLTPFFKQKRPRCGGIKVCVHLSHLIKGAKVAAKHDYADLTPTS